MTAKRQAESVADTERQVLRALCRVWPDQRASFNALRGYRWSEPMHKVLFDLLAGLEAADPELVRVQLPARLTRRGFPDFDLTWFQPHTLSGKELARLIRRLVGTAGSKK